METQHEAPPAAAEAPPPLPLLFPDEAIRDVVSHEMFLFAQDDGWAPQTPEEIKSAVEAMVREIDEGHGELHAVFEEAPHVSGGHSVVWRYAADTPAAAGRFAKATAGYLGVEPERVSVAAAHLPSQAWITGRTGAPLVLEVAFPSEQFVVLGSAINAPAPEGQIQAPTPQPQSSVTLADSAEHQEDLAAAQAKAQETAEAEKLQRAQREKEKRPDGEIEQWSREWWARSLFALWLGDVSAAFATLLQGTFGGTVAVLRQKSQRVEIAVGLVGNPVPYYSVVRVRFRVATGSPPAVSGRELGAPIDKAATHVLNKPEAFAKRALEWFEQAARADAELAPTMPPPARALAR